MARVATVFGDMLFGSKVQGMLSAAGHDVQPVLGDPAGKLAGCDLLVVDLTDDDAARIAAVAAARESQMRVLAFYLHTEVDVRTRALEAGFDQVVPRSRMARAGAALADGLLTSAPFRESERSTTASGTPS